jgi:hypothetical protein
MYEGTDLSDYLVAIREEVCTRCIERPSSGPPCAPLGKRCGIELNLDRLIEAVHTVRSPVIDPYIEAFHSIVCPECAVRLTRQCPCALDYLLMLAVEAIEDVDQQRATASANELQRSR